MVDEEEVGGIEVQSISFRPGENGVTVVEVTYFERREQRRDIALYKVLIFEATKALQTVHDLIESAEDLVDEMLMQHAAVPRTKPSRRA